VDVVKRGTTRGVSKVVGPVKGILIIAHVLSSSRSPDKPGDE
jgi:hypothetical protein